MDAKAMSPCKRRADPSHPAAQNQHGGFPRRSSSRQAIVPMALPTAIRPAVWPFRGGFLIVHMTQEH
jgi:hypothetical protein